MSNSSSFIPHEDLLKQLNDSHVQANAQWDELKHAQGQLAVTRTELDKLTSLGDMVKDDDVLKAAVKLVAAGQDAGTIAGLLADMPQDGPSLQAWIAQQDQMIAEREQRVGAEAKQARHAVATTGLQVLHAYGHLGEPQSQAPQQPIASTGSPVAANPLTAGAA